MRFSYSAVIAADRVDKKLLSVEALSKLPAVDRPREVFVSVGKNPSEQRNIGVSTSKSPLIYFLDDDSEVVPGTPSHLSCHFEDKRTVVAGGPNLCHPDASSFEKTVSAVLASWLGSFKVRTRYAAIGSVKEATEKDLILCNMMVRRGTFLSEGGFLKNLYPNEENEFLNRLLHKGYRLVYDPRGAVYRSRRKSLAAFCWQAFRYGRGRARQIKVYPCLSDIVHLVPAFFVLYLVSLALPWVVTSGSAGGGSFYTSLLKSPFGWVPLGLFALGALGTGISAASWHRRFMDTFKVPVLIFLRQFLYGLGLIVGFLTPSPQADGGPIQLYKVQFRGTRYQLKPVRPGRRRP